MIDIVKRLRANYSINDSSGEAHMALEAAAEIERLHAWRDAKNEACTALEKENERLRGALEPFANSTEIPDSIMSGEMGDEATIAVTFKLGDFRRARHVVNIHKRSGE